jgi:cyclic beta-1,2-glucan synthetase
VDLLLQEQVPQDVPPQYPHETESAERQVLPHIVSADAWHVTINTPLPLVHYLSNGRYGVMVTNAGAGYSSWKETRLTRWRADTTLDNWGSWLYIEDLDQRQYWSAGFQPTGQWPEQHEVLYSPHMVEIRRRDHDVSLHMAITVAPDADVEVRHITLTNDSDQARHLRLTSYSEVVLGPAAADLRHPAFGKLFIESEYLPDLNALIFRRRPRSTNEAPAFLAHVLVASAE